MQLPTVNLGDTNFEDAFGSPGWFLEEFPKGYIAGELKDANGKQLPGSNRVTAYSTISHVAFVSDKRFLGVGLVGEGLVPLVDLDMQLANRTNSEERGVGDLIVGSRTGDEWPPVAQGARICARPEWTSPLREDIHLSTLVRAAIC